MGSRKAKTGPAPIRTLSGRMEGSETWAKSAGGIFVFDQSRGIWTVDPIKKSELGLPNLILKGANKDLANLLERMIKSPLTPGSFAAFVKAIGIKQPPALVGYSTDADRTIDKVGVSVLLDFQQYEDTEGGSQYSRLNPLAADRVPGANGLGFTELILDHDTEVPDNISSISNPEEYVDAVIRLNLLVPHKGPLSSEMIKDKAKPVFTRGGVKYYYYSDLTDKYYNTFYGITTGESRVQLTLEHEFPGHGGHPEGKTAGKSNFGGHGDVFTRITSLRGNTKDFKLTEADLFRSPALVTEFNAAKAAGLLVDENGIADPTGRIWKENKLRVYQDDLNARIKKLKIKTNEDLFNKDEIGDLKKLGTLSIVTITRSVNDFEMAIHEFLDGAVSGIKTVDGAQIGIALGTVLGKRITSYPFENSGDTILIRRHEPVR
jgi:hypothetical protein